jgi:hypothetical protein
MNILQLLLDIVEKAIDQMSSKKVAAPKNGKAYRRRETFDTLKQPQAIQSDLSHISKTCYARNGTAHFKKCKQLFEYQHLLLLKDIWWSKF